MNCITINGDQSAKQIEGIEGPNLNPPPSTSVIFLDMDGVMIRGRDHNPLSSLISNKVHELFEKKEGLNGGFTELEWRIAAGHFLNCEAVAHLDRLIEKVSLVAQVAIVLSSDWRNDGTVEEIKNRMFSTWKFSKLIIDKTLPNYYTENDLEKKKFLLTDTKYGFPIKSRGEQIDYWLRENQAILNIKSFVILDDYDDGIKERYPHHFVEVENGTLSNNDADKACEIMMNLNFTSLQFPSKEEVLAKREKKAAERKEQCVIS